MNSFLFCSRSCVFPYRDSKARAGVLSTSQPPTPKQQTHVPTIITSSAVESPCLLSFIRTCIPPHPQRLDALTWLMVHIYDTFCYSFSIIPKAVRIPSSKRNKIHLDRQRQLIGGFTVRMCVCVRACERERRKRNGLLEH